MTPVSLFLYSRYVPLYLAVYAQASTPTLASRKDLQSPAPLRTKDAATVARDEQEVFAH